MVLRIGQGFDAHAFSSEKPLILGGVLIPNAMGVKAHSDGDVVVHALIDSLLGAAALGDLGTYFPDSDERWRNISSCQLLRQTIQMIHNQNYRVHNVDITIIAQIPKLSPWRESMRCNLSKELQIKIDQISVKFTTTDGLGFIGRSEGIAASSVVLIGH
jgi:2-C-methyl-D-erythritol 2,4-cyclodiphosphate synthase